MGLSARTIVSASQWMITGDVLVDHCSNHWATTLTLFGKEHGIMSAKQTSRRDFLKAAATTAGAGALAASGLQSAIKTTEAAVPIVRARALESKGVLWGLQYDPHVAAYHRMADLFKKQHGVTIQVQPQAWPLDTKIISAVAAGTQPDVACLLGSAIVALYINKVLTPVQDSVLKHNRVDPKKAFLGDAVAAFSWNGDILGVPVESNQVGFMVNVPVEDVQAAGLASTTPPLNNKLFFDSYDHMWAVAKALQTKRGNKVKRWGMSSEGWEAGSLFGIMRALGTKWWDLDAKKFNFNTPAGIKALQLLVETPVKMGIETELADTGINAALAGKVAIVRGNGTPSTQEGNKLGYHFELCAAPRTQPGKDPLFVGEGGWGFSAMRKAKNPNVATAFLQMVATTPGQLEYAKIYGGLLGLGWAGLVGNMQRFADPSPTNSLVKASKVFAEVAPLTTYLGEQFGYYQLLGTIVGNAAQAIRTGKMTSAQAASTIQHQAEAMYKQFLLDVKKAS
jgi:ABC-type glycerol-3-phosphate transport system substrate-binding protein